RREDARRAGAAPRGPRSGARQPPARGRRRRRRPAARRRHAPRAGVHRRARARTVARRPTSRAAPRHRPPPAARAGAPPVTTVPELRAALARVPTGTDAAAVSSAVVAGAATAAQGWRALLDLEARARAELVGAGPLQELLEDTRVTDVLVNGVRGAWVDRGRGLERADVDLGTEPEVRALAARLAAACGQRLDEACPVVDGALPDGTRLHAVLPPLSADGTLISLRTQRGRALTVAELVAGGTVAPAL